MSTRIRQFCSTHRVILRTTFVVVVLFAMPAVLAHAGSDPTFDDANNLLTGWITGSYAKAAALIGIIATLYRAAMGGFFGDDPEDPFGPKVFELGLGIPGVLFVIFLIMIALQMPKLINLVITGLF